MIFDIFACDIKLLCKIVDLLSIILATYLVEKDSKTASVLV